MNGIRQSVPVVGHERLAAVIHRKVVPGSRPRHKFCLMILMEASAKIPAEAATQCAGRVDSSANLPARKRSSTGLHCSIWVRQKMRDPTPTCPHQNFFINCESTMTFLMEKKNMSFGKATARQQLDDSRLHERGSHTLIEREVKPGDHWSAPPIEVLSSMVRCPTSNCTLQSSEYTGGLPL